MSRKRRLSGRTPMRRRKSLLERWTLQRASVVGILFGIGSLLMVGLLGTGTAVLLHLYALALTVTALCGASMLWITASDMRTRGTRGRMRAIRAFDVAVALTLLIPSLYALTQITRELGL